MRLSYAAGVAGEFNWVEERDAGASLLWTLRLDAGAQRARAAGGNELPVGAAGGSELPLGAVDMVRDARGRWWPASFRFAPDDGAALPAPVARPRWSGSGWPALEPPSPDQDGAAWTLEAGSGTVVPVPAGARWFASGGAPGRAVAFDPLHGKAWWHDPYRSAARGAVEWVELRGSPGLVEQEAWSPLAGGGDGVALLGGEGLFHWRPGMAGFARLAPGEPAAGAPALPSAGAAWPVRGDGRVESVCVAADGVRASLPVVDVPLAAGEALGGPFVRYDVATWIAPGGALRLEPQGGGGWRARRLPAPPGWRLLPAALPWEEPAGRLWAFAEDEAGSIRLAPLFPGRDAHPRPLDGMFAALGRTAWRVLDRHDDPREGAAGQVGLDGRDGWVLPVARLSPGETVVALVENSRAMQDFLLGRWAGPPLTGRLMLHRPDRLADMGRAMRLDGPRALTPFLLGDMLCIFNPEEGSCFGWRLHSR